MNRLFTKPISVLCALIFSSPLASAQQATDEEIVFGATNPRSDFKQCRQVYGGEALVSAGRSCAEACYPVLTASRGPAVSPEVLTQCNVRFREFKALLAATSTAPAPVTGVPIPDVEGFLTVFVRKKGFVQVESSDTGPWADECRFRGFVEDPPGDIPDVRDPYSQILVRLVGVQVPPEHRGRRRCTADRIELISP